MSPKTRAIPDVGQSHCWINCLCSHAVHEKGLILPPGLPRNRKAEMLYTNEANREIGGFQKSSQQMHFLFKGYHKERGWDGTDNLAMAPDASHEQPLTRTQ